MLSAFMSSRQPLHPFTWSWAWSGNGDLSLRALSTSLQFIEQLLSPLPQSRLGVICEAVRKRDVLSASQRPRYMTWHGLLLPGLTLPPSPSSPLPAALRAGPQQGCRTRDPGVEHAPAPAAPAAPASHS